MKTEKKRGQLRVVLSLFLIVLTILLALPFCLAEKINQPPFFTQPLSPQSIYLGQTLSYDINCSDVNGDKMTFSDDTELFEIDSFTGKIIHSPQEKDVGTHAIKITCSDGQSAITRSFDYTILTKELPPEVLPTETLPEKEIVTETHSENLIENPPEEASSSVLSSSEISGAAIVMPKIPFEELKNNYDVYLLSILSLFLMGVIVNRLLFLKRKGAFPYFSSSRELPFPDFPSETESFSSVEMKHLDILEEENNSRKEKKDKKEDLKTAPKVPKLYLKKKRITMADFAMENSFANKAMFEEKKKEVSNERGRKIILESSREKLKWDQELSKIEEQLAGL